MHPRTLLILLVLTIVACQKENVKEPTPIEGFETSPVARTLTPGILDEASGIADSKTFPGYLWVEQDGGNTNEISLLSHDGTFLKNITIKSAVNKDWEDLAISSGPIAGTSYLYVADIGDNDLVLSQHAIYRFPEPVPAMTEVLDFDKLSFQYPDGAHDADAILVDNTTKDIYIITKADASSKIYKLPYPQNTNAVNTAVFVGSLSLTGATSAAFSPDGKELLVRTYEKIYHWDKKNEQTIEQALTQTPITLTYQLEPQGEAICFKNDNSGFFTLSERPFIITGISLNFYKRK